MTTDVAALQQLDAEQHPGLLSEACTYTCNGVTCFGFSCGGVTCFGFTCGGPTCGVTGAAE